MTHGSLLIVDDDLQLLESMADWLASQGLQVESARGCAEASEILAKKNFDLALVDIRLQDGDGFDLLEQIRRQFPQWNEGRASRGRTMVARGKRPGSGNQPNL